MKIRLGYACISKTLNNITPSSTFTYTEYTKTHDNNRLDKIIKSNLEDLNKLITYNNKNNIHFFRLSSRLIPLATKDDVIFNYLNPYQKYYTLISKNIKVKNMRVDFHPDQFCILNSTRKEVLNNTIEILKYHYNLLEALKVKDKILILHVGSSVFGKENSIKRFINNFNKLPEYIKRSIAIENDDKIFTIMDCLNINREIKVPVVLDYHHFICNHGSEKIEEVLPAVISSWHNKTPKMHFSSPKNKTKKDFRSHNDYIDSGAFIEFIKILKSFKTNIDIMLEAKAKDEALFRLVRELKYKTDFNFIDETSFTI